MSNQYPGFCVVCNVRVDAGHGKLERSDTGAWVVRCSPRSKASKAKAQKKVTPPKAAVRVSAAKEAGKEAGTCTGHALTRRNAGRDAAILLGETFRAGKRAGPVAGKLVTIQGAETRYVSRQACEDAEDFGDLDMKPGWQATIWVRPATEAEAAPVLALEAARDATASALKRASQIAVQLWSDATRRPESEADTYSVAARRETDDLSWNWETRTRTVGSVLTVRGDEVAAWDSGYYDDYRRKLGVTEDAVLAAEVRALEEQARTGRIVVPATPPPPTQEQLAAREARRSAREAADADREAAEAVKRRADTFAAAAKHGVADVTRNWGRLLGPTGAPGKIYAQETVDQYAVVLTPETDSERAAVAEGKAVDRDRTKVLEVLVTAAALGVEKIDAKAAREVCAILAHRDHQGNFAWRTHRGNINGVDGLGHLLPDIKRIAQGAEVTKS